MVTLPGQKNWPIPTPLSIICHMVLDELWPLVLKHSYAPARLLRSSRQLGLAHGSDYWAAHASAAPGAVHLGLRPRQPVLAGWCCSADGTVQMALGARCALRPGPRALLGARTTTCWRRRDIIFVSSSTASTSLIICRRGAVPPNGTDGAMRPGTWRARGAASRQDGVGRLVGTRVPGTTTLLWGWSEALEGRARSGTGDGTRMRRPPGAGRRRRGAD